MGEVYRARGPDGSRYALKRLPPDAAEDDTLRRRFQREAEAARQLDHPTIVKVFDFFEDEAGCWIVMQLVEGKSLRQEIEERGAIPPRRVHRLVRRLAEGLAVAHGRGIVHRDLKTENVVVGPDGGLKILDFGLAKHLFRDESAPTLTIDGTMVGTCRAMSPEQALGRDVDHRSDLFSLGVLMYEALAGVSPFVAATPLQTVSLLVGQPHRPLLDRNPRVPAALADLVERLLRKKRDERPRSVHEVTAILDRIDAGPSGLGARALELVRGLGRRRRLS